MSQPEHPQPWRMSDEDAKLIAKDVFNDGGGTVLAHVAEIVERAVARGIVPRPAGPGEREAVPPSSPDLRKRALSLLADACRVGGFTVPVRANEPLREAMVAMYREGEAAAALREQRAGSPEKVELAPLAGAPRLPDGDEILVLDGLRYVAVYSALQCARNTEGGYRIVQGHYDAPTPESEFAIGGVVIRNGDAIRLPEPEG